MWRHIHAWNKFCLHDICFVIWFVFTWMCVLWRTFNLGWVTGIMSFRIISETITFWQLSQSQVAVERESAVSKEDWNLHWLTLTVSKFFFRGNVDCFIRWAGSCLFFYLLCTKTQIKIHKHARVMSEALNALALFNFTIAMLHCTHFNHAPLLNHSWD